MLAILQGYKTYIAAFALFAFGTCEYFFGLPKQIDINAYGDMLAVAAGLAGLRNGIAQNLAKTLAALGIDAPKTATVEDIRRKAFAAGPRVVPALLAIVLLLPVLMSLSACSTPTGGDYQPAVYSYGQKGVAVVQIASVAVATSGLKVPPKACSAFRAVVDLYRGAENTVRDPNSTGDAQQKALALLENGLPAALAAAAELGLSFATAEHRAAAAAPMSDPSPSDWDALNAQAATAVQGLGC